MLKTLMKVLAVGAAAFAAMIVLFAMDASAAGHPLC